MNLSKLMEVVEDRCAWCAVHKFKRVGHNLATEQQQIYVCVSVCKVDWF